MTPLSDILTFQHWFCPMTEGAVVAEWLSSWLAEQEVRGSIPGLATWIFRDWLSPASKSRYGWKIAKSTLILKTTNQPHDREILLYLNFRMLIVSLNLTLFYYNIQTKHLVQNPKFRWFYFNQNWAVISCRDNSHFTFPLVWNGIFCKIIIRICHVWTSLLP